jgi:flagellar basal body-associated protein FliL
MKKTNLIIIVVVVILLLLGAWFFLFNKKTPGTGQQTASTAGSQNQEVQSKSGIKESLLGLLEKGTGIKCTVFPKRLHDQ